MYLTHFAKLQKIFENETDKMQRPHLVADVVQKRCL